MWNYEHTQVGTLLLAVTGGGAVIAGGIGVFNLFSAPPAATIPIVVATVLAICSILFYRLTVRMSSDHIVVTFGVGLIKKRISVIDIQATAIVRNRWYYGWGIRLTPHGWLFNVSGFDAVEIQLKNGRMYRIGTDEPTKLVSAIKSEIARPANETIASVGAIRDEC